MNAEFSLPGDEPLTRVEPLRAAAAPPPDRLDLGYLIVLLKRRLALFAIVFLVIFDLAIALLFVLPQRYTATAVVVLNATDTPVTPGSEHTKSDEPASASDVETEMAIITSRAIATRVVDYLHLDRDEQLRRELLGGGTTDAIKRALHLGSPIPPPPTDAAGRAKLRDQLAGMVTRNLDLNRVSSAYAIAIVYTDSHPKRAAAIANAIAHLYTADQVGLKQQQNKDAVDVLGGRIESLRGRAQADFDAVQRYRIRTNLLSTTGASLTEQEISAYNQQVAAARAQADADQAALNTARGQLASGSTGEDVGEALGSPVIQQLRVQRAQLSARVADYAGTLGPKNPDLLDALRQLADIDKAIQAEIGRVISNLAAKARVSNERLASLRGSLGAARGTLAQNNAAMVSLDDLQRRADTSQALYESYLNRYKEAVAAVGAERPDSRTVTDARVPGAPSFPNIPLVLLLGGLLGIGAGFVAAIVTELSYAGLTTGEDVKRRLGVAYFGGLPNPRTIRPPMDDLVTAIRSNPRSIAGQTARGVLTKLRQTGGRAQVVLVTSALPEEGKTTTVAALALAASRTEQRAIVIDCDTVRHRFTDRAGIDASGRPGLREVLSGEVAISAALIEDPITGVHLLPCSPTKDDEPFNINLDRMGALLAHLRDHFQLILIDSPPVLPIVEAREIATLVDKVVVVARWRSTDEKAVATAIELLPPLVRSAVGVVLSQVNLKKLRRFGARDAGAFYGTYGEYHAKPA